MKKLPRSMEKQNRSYQTFKQLWATEPAGQCVQSSTRATLCRSSMKPITCIQTPHMSAAAGTRTFNAI